MTSDATIREIVLGMWKALSNRDWETLKTFLSDDCIYLDVPVGPAAAAKGPDDIVMRLKIGLEPLASYENLTGLMVANGGDVMYEHREEWHWTTGESAVMQFVVLQAADNRKQDRRTTAPYRRIARPQQVCAVAVDELP